MVICSLRLICIYNRYYLLTVRNIVNVIMHFSIHIKLINKNEQLLTMVYASSLRPMVFWNLLVDLLETAGLISLTSALFKTYFKTTPFKIDFKAAPSCSFSYRWLDNPWASSKSRFDLFVRDRELSTPYLPLNSRHRIFQFRMH